MMFWSGSILPHSHLPGAFCSDLVLQVPILVAFRVEQQPDGTPVTLTPLHQATLSHNGHPQSVIPAGGFSNTQGTTTQVAVHHAPSHSQGLRHGLPSMASTTPATNTDTSAHQQHQESTGIAAGPLVPQTDVDGSGAVATDGGEGENGVTRVDTIQGEGPVRTLACIFKVCLCSVCISGWIAFQGLQTSPVTCAQLPIVTDHSWCDTDPSLLRPL
jgi:hypothetical protein